MWRGWIFSVFGILLMACEVEPLRHMQPKIAVDACAQELVLVDGVSFGGTQQCDLPLNEVDLSTETIKQIVIANPSSVPLTIHQVSLKKAEKSPFAIDKIPQKVLPGEKSELIVRYRPFQEEDAEDVLTIKSDAGNVSMDGQIVIPISAKAVDKGLPDIEVNLPACDFSLVGVGHVKQCPLVVKNVGVKPLVFNEVSFLAETLEKPTLSSARIFSVLGRLPVYAEQLLPGEQIPLTVNFTPDITGNFAQILVIKTNDPDESVLQIPLNGKAVLGPTAKCKIKTINNRAFSEGRGIEPLDNVIVSAEESIPGTADTPIVSYVWEIIKQPTGSTAWLTNPSGIDTGFTFADGVLGLDLAGKYELKLTVVDSLGLESLNDCRVVLNAIPTDSLHVQLTWDTSDGDMDLHLAKEDSDGKFCVSNLNFSGHPGPLGQTCTNPTWTECNYATCRVASTTRPNWDNQTTFSDGDPLLDIDDLRGYGPENINIKEALDGSYLVSVHNYGGGIRAGNTVRIYLYGQLSAEFNKDLRQDEWWEVAIIRLQTDMSGYPCIQDLSSQTVTCPDPVLP